MNLTREQTVIFTANAGEKKAGYLSPDGTRHALDIQRRLDVWELAEGNRRGHWRRVPAIPTFLLSHVSTQQQQRPAWNTAEILIFFLLLFKRAFEIFHRA